MKAILGLVENVDEDFSKIKHKTNADALSLVTTLVNQCLRARTRGPLKLCS